MLQENKYYSYNLNELPRGCQYCVRGEKLVLFVTGICPRQCYFCPVSDQKYQKDIQFANERLITSEADILKEADNMKARGAGITGGDPLSKQNRTVSYIKLLKQKYGKEFHIHLYTSLNLVTEENLKKLFDAGLDEIRFHLDLDSESFWPKLALAKKFSWDVGVEVPLIPSKEKELIKMIDFVNDKIDFINLNELEVADNSQSKLAELGLQTKDDLSYAVKDSLNLGLRLLQYIEKRYGLTTHVCTAKLKDAIQLTNRIRREADGAKHIFDEVDSEGLLIRGAIYLPELAPGFGYRKKLEVKTEKEFVIKKLKELLPQIKQKLQTELFLDESKARIILSAKTARKHKKEIRALGLLAAVVKEYPTADQLEIEVDFLP